MTKKMIELKTQDGVCDAYVSYPESHKPLPGVILYMDAVGLRNTICTMADYLAEKDYFVLTPNTFYRTNKSPIVDYATLLPNNTPELFKQVMPIAAQLKQEMSKKDVLDFVNYFRTQPNVNSEKLAAIGYCMGGGQALRAAGNYPTFFKAVASFHSGNLATDAENSPSLLFKNIQAEVYIAHADHDKNMPPEQIQRVETELKAAHLKFKTETYKGCLHGWTMKDLPVYNPDGERRHWENVFSLLERTLKT